ncbi:MAG TPA: dihydroorotate dehydrogenase [Thermoanaerobaculia bacterium]|nr:dihydroorotate dehydrogenase [Thermoanaerobaculia bacterium]
MNPPNPSNPANPSSQSLARRLGPLELKNPILTASGTFGYGLEFTDFVDLGKLGGICTKGLSLKPHAGNIPPRICETPSGMLNAIGLQNVGVEAFLAEKLPRLRELRATVIPNVWGDLEEDYVAVVEALEEAPGIAAIELNISCPNVEKGGMLFGNSPEATESLVARVRRATSRPLIVKLSPNAPDLVQSARAARDGGADVLSLVNTFVGMAIDPETAKPRISFGTGGLSGPAIRPLAVRMVFQVARALPGFPLMGIGGISDLSDVLEFLAAGASAIQVGTANFKEPGVSGRLVDELTAYCDARGMPVSALVGRALESGAPVLEKGAEG